MKYTSSELKRKLSANLPLSWGRKQDISGCESKGTPNHRRHTFGDFFVHEATFGTLKPERVSKHTSFVISEGFQIEAEKIYTQKLERKVVRKVDLRIIPVVALLYFLTSLARSSVGHARVAGFQDDLGFTDHQFSLSLTLTFISSILVELPSNFIMLKVGARLFIPGLVTLLGLVILCHGLLANYPAFLAASFLLGLFEGGILPGILLYLSFFYTRSDLQLRIAMFYSMTCLSGAFSRLFTYGFIHLDSARGLAGWGWLFLIEGVLIIFLGISGFFALPSTLQTVNFLSEEEKKILYSRLSQDHGPVGLELEKIKAYRPPHFQMWQALRSPHVLLCCLAMAFVGTNVDSLPYFVSITIVSFGYNPLNTRLLAVPPYIIALIFMFVSTCLSIKFKTRAMTISICGGISAIGFLGLYISDESASRFISLLFSMSGVYGCIPALLAWMSNNSEPFVRKATTLALGPMFGNLGKLLSVWLFAYSDKQRYYTPAAINIAFALLVIACCLVNIVYLSYAEYLKYHLRQKLLKHYAIEDYRVDPGVHELLYLNGWESLGDRHPDFEYTL